MRRRATALTGQRRWLTGYLYVGGGYLDVTMRWFEEVPGDAISKEAFVCILALFYEYVGVLLLSCGPVRY